MDLSPKLLTEIEFREQWRGYNPGEVDEFLERVAAAVGELQQRLAEALDRAATAERRLLDRTDEDEIRRTLVLAQRTAVAAMEEARADADRMVSETEARCRQLVADAETEAARLDAEIATRRRTELGALADQRAALELDLENLRQFAETERARVADILRMQLTALERDFAVGEVPAVSELPAIPDNVPQPEPEEPARDWDAIELEDADETAAPEDEAEIDPAVDELRRAREELADALRSAGVEPLPLAEDPPSPSAPFDDQAEESEAEGDTFSAWAPAEEGDAPAAALEEDETPDERPRWRDDEEEDDPFLAELRRAVIDPEPLGPRDHQPPARPAGDDDGDPAAGFFRRGRRRE